MNEALVLKYLLINIYYYKYINIIIKYINKDYNKYIYNIIKYIIELKERFPNKEHTVDDLQALFYAKESGLKEEEQQTYRAIFEKSNEVVDVSDEIVLEVFESFLARIKSTQIAAKAIEVQTGKASFDSLETLWSELVGEGETTEELDYLVSTDLGDLHAVLMDEVGVRWRLDTLNKTIGSLRRGNLVVIAARPETGKTTFLASEGSCMVSQIKGNYLHVNNEETGTAVLLRYYQALLGLTQEELFRNLEENKRKYHGLVGNRINIYDKPFATRKDIEGLCKKLNPEIIVIDQLDKVQGFDAERNDLVLKAKYQWARELAKQYGPVIAVGQAGGTAENKRYLDMNDLDSSATAKQGECDVIIGIGKVHDEGYENVRYLSIMKNKLPGDKDTKPELRHAKIDVRIKPEIARYEDARKL